MTGIRVGRRYRSQHKGIRCPLILHLTILMALALALSMVPGCVRNNIVVVVIVVVLRSSTTTVVWSFSSIVVVVVVVKWVYVV